MSGWKKNFETLHIDQLRSPISAHADPFDHRSLEFFAAHTHRDSELVPMEHVAKTNDRWDFHGPYNTPSTELFHDFHRQLITGYGIQNMVTPGNVESIHFDTSGQFQVLMTDPRNGQVRIVQTPRVVCAVGSINRKAEPLLHSPVSPEHWQASPRVLKGSEIIHFLTNQQGSKDEKVKTNQSILIVGGGVTSAHLALTACNENQCPWCESAIFIQRSEMKERQFDLDSAWMGPGRGNRLDQFWNLSHQDRASRLRKERGGGTIPPEVVCMLKKKSSRGPRSRLSVQEETEIVHVEYDSQRDKLVVALDDGLPPKAFDMIWLATGFDNQIDNYPFLEDIRNQLPVNVVEGLPVLAQDLSWKRDSDGAVPDEVEPSWKANARNRFWMMGPLAGLELGPDALNLMGARHGAVRVAKALRADISKADKMSRTDTNVKLK